MISVFTGKTPRDQAVVESCSFNLVRAIRVRRLQWVGHILRLDADRFMYRAVKCLYDCQHKGDMHPDGCSSHRITAQDQDVGCREEEMEAEGAVGAW